MHRNSKIAISLSFLTFVSGLYNVNYNYAQTLNSINCNKISLSQECNYIESVKLKKKGTIEFTLNKATDKELTLGNVCILCNGGNKMTINKISTKDKKTYILTTPFYKDNMYTLSVELPNEIISKEFKYSYNHPTTSDVTIDRTSDTSATINLYDVDEGGNIYYKVVERNNSIEENIIYNLRERSISISNDITVNDNNITVSDIKSSGNKDKISVGYNEILVNNLKKGKEYDVYYFLESNDNRTSPVYGPIGIDTYKEDNTIYNYKLEKVEEVEENKIMFKFNKPVNNININDILITCPRGSNLTTAGSRLIASKDKKTYTLVLSNYYRHKDNKYDVAIKMPDNSKVTGSFVSHFNPPTIYGGYLSKKTNGKLNFNFTSDESGRILYGFYESNGSIYASSSNTPKAIDVIKGRVNGDIHEVDLKNGENNIEIDISNYNIKSDSQLWVLYIDNANNYRTGFVDHYSLSKFKGSYNDKNQSNKEDENKSTNLDIESIGANNYYGYTSLCLTFTDDLVYTFRQDDVKIESLNNNELPSNIRMSFSFPESKLNYAEIGLVNKMLSSGKYRITINVLDATGKPVTIVKEFEI